jgi:hypothetical protein
MLDTLGKPAIKTWPEPGGLRPPLAYLWRPETGIFVAVWLVLLVGGRSRLFQDPGTFWHVVVGERILTTREFLDYDPFSYTFGGQPWTPYEWLGECAMALIHRIDGFDTLLLASATGIACLFTWIGHRLMRAGLHWSLTAACLMLLLGASASHLHVRPHLFTIALLAITFAQLVDFEAGRIPIRRLVWLIPLFVVWTNIHGGMLGGLGTLLVVFVGWLLWRVFGLYSPLSDGRANIRLAALISACGLAALVNPYGADLPRTWLAIMQMPLLPEIIREHAPLNPARPDGILVLVLGATYVAALLGIRPREMRVNWLLPLVWLVLACMRIRHAPLFAVTAGLALADFLPHTRWAQRLAQSGSDLFRPVPAVAESRLPWPAFLIPSALVALAVALQVLRIPTPIVGHQWAELDPQAWPVEALPELRRAAEENPGGRIFNEYEYGGFLIYYAPELRVYVDDRCEVYGDQWLARFVSADADPGAYLDDQQTCYGRFNLALTRTGSGYDRYFQSAGWQILVRTETATLYQRTNPPG